jgi:two-component system, NtrC family, sensor kinase
VPSLFVIRGNDQGIRFELEEPVLRLGRDKASGIHLHDTEVSRHHAEFRRTHREYTVSDLDSSNGTFVNGKRVQQHVLASGDQVQAGATLMLYTGFSDGSSDDIGSSVDIAATAHPDDQSRIIHSVTQKEGSRIFDLEAELPQNSWLARARSNLQVMYRTALAVSHTLDIDQLLNRIMELIFEWVEADRGCIMLFDPELKQLNPCVRRTRTSADQGDKITISKTILDYVVERNEGVLTSDARQDDRFNPGASIVRLGVREAICVPMQGRYHVVGVIYIDTSTSAQQVLERGGAARRFTEDHLKLMVAIGHQAALAVEDTRYYSAMVQAERLAAIGQTIATLSHHIKNILQGIRGGSYLIEMGLTDHDESIVGKGWKIVEKNQNKISALVMDMLTFSKEREPDLVVSNLNTVVRDCVELMQVRAQEEQVELITSLAEGMPDLVFDPEGIHRAVLNIVTNAIDAVVWAESETPGRVTVTTRYLPDVKLAQVEIRDTGPGIAPDQMDKLFSPFVSTKKSRGTGLGLPVSQKIMTEHGGKITVESSPNQGACFTLDLPAVSPGSQTQITEPPTG